MPASADPVTDFLMSPAFLVVIAACGALGIAAYLLVAMRLGRKRKQGAEALVAERGWQHVDEDPALVLDVEQEPFGAGTKRSATGVVRGTVRGVPFASFHYGYWLVDVRHRNASQPSYHVVATRLPAPVEPFAVRARLTGGHAVFGESAAQRQRIESSPIAARMAQPDAKGFSVAAHGQHLWVYRQVLPVTKHIEPMAGLLADIAHILAPAPPRS